MKKRNQIKPTLLPELMIKRKHDLEYIINETDKSLANAPQGSLHAVPRYNGKNYQFYLSTNDHKGKREYLGKDQQPLIAKLAQKKYDQIISQRAHRELALIDKYLSMFSNDIIPESYSKLKNKEQALISPFSLDDESYVSLWESVAYERLGFRDEAPEFFSNKGERMRFKSELLIANTLLRLGIPYHYEYPLQLKNGLIIHPDFAILDIKKRQVYYWEQLGMMDDMEYIKNAIKKIESYQSCNLFPGKELILTHETSKNPLSSKLIEDTIKKYINNY